jgi:hypothetical protein
MTSQKQVSDVQRTWDMQIPCRCANPALCDRYHGLQSYGHIPVGRMSETEINQFFVELRAKHRL